MRNRVDGLIKLMGALFVDCFHILENKTPSGLWLGPSNKCPLKNLGLVMGLAIGVNIWIPANGDYDWCQLIEQMADENHIQLRDGQGPIPEVKVPAFSTQVCIPTPLASSFKLCKC